MKKLGKVLIVSILAMSLLVACGGGKSGNIEMGVASTQLVKDSTDRATEDLGVEFTVVVAGVALKDGKVSYIKIDESQQFAYVRDAGIFEGETQPTKGVKKEAYGMLEASKKAGLGKEWYEQIEAVEAALIGKTKEEVKTYFEGEEVKTASTMELEHISATVLKALDQTIEVKGAAKVGLGYEPTVTIKKDKDGNEGVAPETTLDYAMIAVDADGKIVKALLDNAQEKAKLVDGKIELVNIGKTKGELKEEYNMIVASPIKKEWFEQNNSIMEILEGMTVSEFAAYDADAAKVDDIKATVTMKIGAYQTALKNAEANLKDLQ